MKLLRLMAAAILTATAPALAAQEAAGPRARAQAFFEAMYLCRPEAVEALAAPDVVVSYPIFEEIFGTPALRGREAVRSFAERFCTRWSDPTLTVHETVREGDRVVLLWSFQATPAGEEGSPGARQSWGGITLLRLDAEGRVVEEVGEESAPGPWGRTRPGG